MTWRKALLQGAKWVTEKVNGVDGETKQSGEQTELDDNGRSALVRSKHWETIPPGEKYNGN